MTNDVRFENFASFIDFRNEGDRGLRIIIGHRCTAPSVYLDTPFMVCTHFKSLLDVSERETRRARARERERMNAVFIKGPLRERILDCCNAAAPICIAFTLIWFSYIWLCHLVRLSLFLGVYALAIIVQSWTVCAFVGAAALVALRGECENEAVTKRN